MITISLCMIVKNEDPVIGRCLEMVADLVDEFIIVDIGSTDDTASVVNRFTSKIYTFSWNDDFAAARNYAFKQATMDYILWLDANDVIEPVEQAKLHELKQTLDPDVDSVTMVDHLSKDEYGHVTLSLRRHRLVRRSRNFCWIGPVHAYLEVEGHIVHSNIVITHLCSDEGKDSDQNLKMYESLLSEGEVLASRDLYGYANELKEHGFYHQAIMSYRNFLNGDEGWIEDKISACGKMADCYHALEDGQSKLESTLRSLQYDRPRPEFCCQLGYHFLNEHNYEAAIFWYTTAIQVKLENSHLGFINPAFMTWLPHLQLSVCYDRIGKYELASQHNEFALQYRPRDAKMLQRREYFQERLGQMLEEETDGMSSLSGKKFRILIGSPVHQKPKILERFLASLSNLEQNSYEAVFFFIDDNDEPASSELLQNFSSRHAGTIIKRMISSSDYIRNEMTHYWTDHLIWKVAGYKDIIIQHAREQQFDGLFLIDSDLLLHPRTIEQLLGAKVDVVAEVFWTRWQPEAYPQPQVWLKDEYTQYKMERGEMLNDEQVAERYKSFSDMLQIPGLYEVGGLGACTLINMRVLEAGVNFRPIPNLSFWGEDRHFCIRAAAFGFSLYVDTHFPAYHIYRDSDLPGADDFLAHHSDQEKSKSFSQSEKSGEEEVPLTDQPYRAECEILSHRHSTLTLSMVVRNEAKHYLKQALQEHRAYIDQAVIIDDGSTDETIEVVMDTLRGIPVKLVRNSRSKFDNEVELRKQQWQETLDTDPTWILNLDADEWFEQRFAEELEGMLHQNEIDLYCFRLYDFWNETHYREDAYWRAHFTYYPFLIRYQPSLSYRWKETPLHCGRLPENIWELPHQISHLRVKHFGWAKEEQRHEKFHRYQELDPQATYGWREQYNSILDPTPNLIEWIE